MQNKLIYTSEIAELDNVFNQLIGQFRQIDRGYGLMVDKVIEELFSERVLKIMQSK